MVYEIEAKANTLPDTHETAAEEVMLPSTHENMHCEAAIQPSGDKSDSVALMSSRIYRELQNPDLADVALSDAHLIQFLDCGGQLAYHDILPTLCQHTSHLPKCIQRRRGADRMPYR